MVAPPQPTRIPLGRAVDTFLDDMNARALVGSLSPATVRNYRADLSEFATIIGADTVTDDITGQDVDRAIYTYGTTPDGRYSDTTVRPRRDPGKEGRSVSTQARFRRTLNTFFMHAEKNAWVQVSPMEWSTLAPRVRGGLDIKRTAMTFDQAEALLLHGPGSPDAEGRSHERNYERDRFLLGLLLILGPRVSEVAAANDEDITTVDGAEVWRVLGKGGKVRHLTLSPWLSRVKREYLEVRPEGKGSGVGALVRTGRGTRITPRDVQRLLPRAEHRVAAAAPDLARRATPHALRHTAATLMLARGVDVKVVSHMLGHASIATTGLYLDELPGELAEAVAGSFFSVESTPRAPSNIDSK